MPAVLVRLAIELGQGFPHPIEFGLAVTLEDGRVSLPEHLRDEVIGDAAGAESRRERVT